MVLLKNRVEESRLREFEHACSEWLRLHTQCYGASFVRPKTHFVHHLAAQPREDRFWLDCFVHERKHQAIKSEAEYIRNTTSFEQSVLNSVLLTQLPQQDQIMQHGLVGARADLPELSLVFGLPCLVANKMRCNFTPYGVGDIVFAGDIAVRIAACISVGGGDPQCIVRKLVLQGRPSPSTARWVESAGLLLFDLCEHRGRHPAAWYEEGGVFTTLGP